MNNIRRQHAPSFKAKVALELIKGVEPVTAICSKHGIHPTQANHWKQQMLNGLELIFSETPSKIIEQKEELIEKLYQQIGKLTVKRDWLKKKLESG